MGKVVIRFWLRMRHLEAEDRNVLRSGAMWLILFPERSTLMIKSGMLVSRESICQTNVTIVRSNVCHEKTNVFVFNMRKVIIVQLFIPD